MSRVILFSLLTSLSCIYSFQSIAAERLFPATATANETRPQLSQAGEFEIGVRTIELTNRNQVDVAQPAQRIDRTLTVEVWYPISEPGSNASLAIYKDVTRSGQQFALQGQAWRDAEFKQAKQTLPVVIFSHGYTGYRSLFFHLAEHLASHGYLVASIDHSDSTNSEVDFAISAWSGMPSTLLNRSRDQSFVLEALYDHPKFGKSLQAKAGLVGYSMGGYGALNTVGGCHQVSGELLAGFGYQDQALNLLQQAINQCRAGLETVDNRWQAMAAFAPWGGASQVHDLDSLTNIDLPVLFIGGDHDDVSGFENGMLPLFKALGSKDKGFLIYQNARHNIAGHPAPEIANSLEFDLGHYFEPVWDARQMAYINQHFLLSFMNCHVRDEQAACAMLPSREFARQQGEQKPWPGFSDRWGLGLRYLNGDNSDSLKDE